MTNYTTEISEAIASDDAFALTIIVLRIEDDILQTWRAARHADQAKALSPSLKALDEALQLAKQAIKEVDSRVDGFATTWPQKALRGAA